jgi:hypothetical protein
MKISLAFPLRIATLVLIPLFLAGISGIITEATEIKQVLFLALPDAQFARAVPTLTKLLDGTVLIVGGGESETTPSLIYNSETKLFSSISASIGNTLLHTATPLPNGNVVIIGGRYYDSRGVQTLDSIKIYNANIKQFTEIGKLKTPRAGHTATQLPNGKILIVGGFDNNLDPIPSAEVFDPLNEVTQDIGNSKIPRAFHTATLLANGKVLVAGGTQVAAAKAELYDPETNEFTLTSDMTSARYSHSATLLPSGRVLIVGGGDGLTSAELFDPASNTFSATGNLTEGRRNHSATLLSNGDVLIVRGIGKGDSSIASAEIFTSLTGKFSIAGRSALAGGSHSAILLPKDAVLVVGGQGSSVTPAELVVPAQVAFLPLAQYQLPPTATPTPIPSCDPSYPTVCIPPPPPTLNCSNIPYRNFRVLPPDPHGFDHDGDGIGCET